MSHHSQEKVSQDPIRDSQWIPDISWCSREHHGTLHEQPIKKIEYTLPETNSKRPWKWMVGRRSFPFGMAYFQGRLLLVSGRVSSPGFFRTNCSNPKPLKLPILPSSNLSGNVNGFTSWWFQPIWKIWTSNWIISPGIGVEINIFWNHHPVSVQFLKRKKCLVNTDPYNGLLQSLYNWVV